MDAVRALVDGVETVVAVELLDRELAGVTVAAVNLDGEIVCGQTPLGWPRLGDRREYIEQQTRSGCLVCVSGLLQIDELAGVQAERECSFDIGLLRQQHSFDVSVLDDRYGLGGRVLLVDRPSLSADLGVLEGGEVARVTQ
ncbi:Uncharacterised protein [Mycobacteroides abscessus subsp. abscessus]|nr:Uncharacterised protein [Mycobacteroides abscessus subsp. abscessus]